MFLCTLSDNIFSSNATKLVQLGPVKPLMPFHQISEKRVKSLLDCKKSSYCKNPMQLRLFLALQMLLLISSMLLNDVTPSSEFPPPNVNDMLCYAMLRYPRLLPFHTLIKCIGLNCIRFCTITCVVTHIKILPPVKRSSPPMFTLLHLNYRRLLHPSQPERRSRYIPLTGFLPAGTSASSCHSDPPLNMSQSGCAPQGIRCCKSNDTWMAAEVK